MKHYLLTRSAYGPDVPLDVNQRRLDLLQGVTVRSLAAQTERNVTWLVLIDPRDPLLDERTKVLESAGLPLILATAGSLERSLPKDRPKGSWAEHIDWSESVMTSRLDDDDAIAPWVLFRFHDNGLARERKRGRRIVWIMTDGWRVARGKAARRHDPVAQFSSLFAPFGDHATIMDINHTSVARLGIVRQASPEPAWLWLRHADTRSVNSRSFGYQGETMRPLTKTIRATFDVDWELIEGLT